MFNIRNTMSKSLVTIEANESPEQALMIMKNHHFRHLPVTDKEGKIIGIVSDRDLYRGINFDEKSVSSVMSRELVCVDIKSHIKDCVHSLVQKKISALLVTRDGTTMGIITSEDLLLLLVKQLEEQPEEVSVLENLLKSAQEVTHAVLNPYLIS